MAGARRGLSTMAALLVCVAAAMLATTAHANGGAEDEKDLTSSSFNPQQLAVKPDPGFYDCIAAFSRLTACAGDIWNTVTKKQPHIGPTCCKVFGGIQYECAYRFFTALNIEVPGLDIWTDMLKSGCKRFKFFPRLPP